MEVTELGIVMLVKPLQPLKAESPIEVTESGISIEVKYRQLPKHSAGICNMLVKYLNSLKVLMFLLS